MVFVLPWVVIYAYTEILKTPESSDQLTTGRFGAAEARKFFETHAEALNPLTFEEGQPQVRSGIMEGVNLSPVWKDAVAYANEDACMVEIPLFSGTFMRALQKRIRHQRKMYHEYTEYDRKLMIVQGNDRKVTMFVVTLIPDPEQNTCRLSDFRYLGESSFTGLVLCSTLEGHFVEGYRYKDGKKLQRVHVFLKSKMETMGMELAGNYEKLRLYEGVPTRVGYLFDEIDRPDEICPNCGGMGTPRGCAYCGQFSFPEVVVTYCPRCYQEEEYCICCPVCQDYPCKCCPDCYSYPCICDRTCGYCHSYPCECHFCEYCNSRYCWGECQNVEPEPEEPDNDACLGEKCVECGGIIPGAAPSTQGKNCPECKCPVKQIDCDVTAARNTLKSAGKWDLLKDAKIQTEFIGKYQTTSTEYGMCLNYNSDLNQYVLSEVFDDGKINGVNIKYTYGEKVYSVAAIHNHPASTPPSIMDIFFVAKVNSQTEGRFTTYFTVGKNRRIYSLEVENKDLAGKFYNQMKTVDGHLDTDKISSYNEDYPKILKTMISNIPEEMDEADIYQYAVAYLLKKYNTGIVLLCLEGEIFKQRFSEKITETDAEGKNVENFIFKTCKW